VGLPGMPPGPLRRGVAGVRSFLEERLHGILVAIFTIIFRSKRWPRIARSRLARAWRSAWTGCSAAVETVFRKTGLRALLVWLIVIFLKSVIRFRRLRKWTARAVPEAFAWCRGLAVSVARDTRYAATRSAGFLISRSGAAASAAGIMTSKGAGSAANAGLSFVSRTRGSLAGAAAWTQRRLRPAAAGMRTAVAASALRLRARSVSAARRLRPVRRGPTLRVAPIRMRRYKPPREPLLTRIRAGLAGPGRGTTVRAPALGSAFERIASGLTGIGLLMLVIATHLGPAFSATIELISNGVIGLGLLAALLAARAQAAVAVAYSATRARFARDIESIRARRKARAPAAEARQKATPRRKEAGENALSRLGASLAQTLVTPRYRIAIAAVLVLVLAGNGLIYFMRLDKVEADRTEAEKALSALNQQLEQVQRDWNKDLIEADIQELEKDINEMNVYFPETLPLVDLGELLVIELSEEKFGVKVLTFTPYAASKTLDIGGNTYQAIITQLVVEGALDDISNFLGEVEYRAAEAGEIYSLRLDSLTLERQNGLWNLKCDVIVVTQSTGVEESAGGGEQG